MEDKAKCEECEGTGICGDEGPGMRNARHEWVPCDCPLGEPHKILPPPEIQVLKLEKQVKDLQSRLIERTEQSTATAYRDAERIRVLEQENRELKAMLSGKEEVV